MRPILFPLAVAVLSLSACGGDSETSDEEGNTASSIDSAVDGDADEAGSDDASANGAAPVRDDEQLVADLEPPNSSAVLSQSTSDGIIYMSWEASGSQEDLQQHYEDLLTGAGYTISSRGSAGVSYEWIFGIEGESDFRGVVTVSPGNGASIVAVQVGADI